MGSFSALGESCHMPDINCLTLYIIHQMAYNIYQIEYSTCLISDFICHMSDMRCHMSHARCHMSDIRVSSICNHEIARLRKIFENLRKLWTNECKRGKTGTNFMYLSQFDKVFSHMFNVNFYACLCAKFSIGTF